MQIPQQALGILGHAKVPHLLETEQLASERTSSCCEGVSFSSLGQCHWLSGPFSASSLGDSRVRMWPCVQEIQEQQATLPCSPSAIMTFPIADVAKEPSRGVIEDPEDPAAVVGLPSTSKGPSPPTTSKLSDSPSHRATYEQGPLMSSSATNLDKF